MTRAGYGIVDTAGYDNIIIQNLTLAQKNASVKNSHGIYFKNVANSKMENISITTEGSSSDGVYLNSSGSSTFSNFNITTSNISAYGIYMYLSDSNYFSGFNIATSGIAAHGIYLKSANSNIIKDSSIVSKSSNDYYLQNTGTVNSFINTNFTTRKIYLYDNSSSFNYSNETNNGIWLNTIQIISPSATLAITRTLINWTRTNISWQEKLTAPRRLSYSMSGLLADANYSVWNGSAIDYNLTTDGSGNLPVFKINLSTSAKMIRVISAQDIAPVTPYLTSWGNNKTNNNSLIMAVNTSEAVNFNAAANQTITTWNWYQDGVNQNNNYDNFTAFWNTAGTKTVQVNATNSNGTSNTVTWIVTVLIQPEVYIPSSPTNINSTTGNFWVNHTWQAGAGNTTDSYNVSVNGTWYNGTTNTYYNNMVGPHGWSNITVWAYNSSGTGSLSAGSISQDTQVPNSPPSQYPIGNKNIIAGDLLTFTVSAMDADNDTITYGTNATAGTLNSTTGVYSWITTTSDAGTYIWTFSSRDNYGGVASETIAVNVINQGQEIWIKLNNDSGELIVNDSPSLDNGTGLSSATWNIWATQNKYKLNAGLFGKYQPVAGNRSYVIRTSDVDGISVVLSADGTNIISYSSNTSRDCGMRNNNEWTLITVTYDGSHIIYYRNGVRCDSDSTTINSLRNSPVPLRIGGGNSVFFNGSIDDILMYNKGLPGHQIYRFYQESEHGLAGRQTIPALIYHRVTDPADASDKISTNNFNQQIAYLHDNNFTTITTENFNQWLKGNFTMPKRPVIVFFDDGWNYTYNNALSTLDKYGYVGVVPVVTNYANFTDDTSYMRWWQLQELQNKGWEIVSHSIDHVSMLTLNESDFRNELNLSSIDIEKNLGKKPASFIFPYNYANTTYTTICGEYYDLCWAYGSKDTWPYYNDYADNGHMYQSLKRITIYNTTTMQTFKNMFAREISIPIGAWELNEDTGSIAYDSSGNGNNALLNANATWHNDSTISSVISPAINPQSSTQKPKKSQQEPPLPPSETLS